ncbi:hypothetical protein TWF481_008190 [Arthrobotrys musiformis]|uniref:Uncharacterized protein n=1 Tax=Arthrobotrys musiformis TaxID=47236 RepID=A0AAV9W6E1_9PEZI
MSGLEIAALVIGAITGLVPVFKEGYVLVKEYRQQKKSKLLLTQDGSTEALGQTLGDSSTALQSRYDTLYSSHGKRFAAGDSISREELSRIIIVLQGELIVSLRAALTGGTLRDPDYLNSVAAKSRFDAIEVLGQLAQRLSTAAPILSNPAPPRLPGPRIQELNDNGKPINQSNGWGGNNQKYDNTNPQNYYQQIHNHYMNPGKVPKPVAKQPVAKKQPIPYPNPSGVYAAGLLAGASGANLARGFYQNKSKNSMPPQSHVPGGGSGFGGQPSNPLLQFSGYGQPPPQFDQRRSGNSGRGAQGQAPNPSPQYPYPPNPFAIYGQNKNYR